MKKNIFLTLCLSLILISCENQFTPNDNTNTEIPKEETGILISSTINFENPAIDKVSFEDPYFQTVDGDTKINVFVKDDANITHFDIINSLINSIQRGSSSEGVFSINANYDNDISYEQVGNTEHTEVITIELTSYEGYIFENKAQTKTMYLFVCMKLEEVEVVDPTPTLSKDYYVAGETGRDSNSGTKEYPFRTVQHAVNRIIRENDEQTAYTMHISERVTETVTPMNDDDFLEREDGDGFIMIQTQKKLNLTIKGLDSSSQGVIDASVYNTTFPDLIGAVIYVKETNNSHIVLEENLTITGDVENGIQYYNFAGGLPTNILTINNGLITGFESAIYGDNMLIYMTGGEISGNKQGIDNARYVKMTGGSVKNSVGFAISSMECVIEDCTIINNGGGVYADFITVTGGNFSDNRGTGIRCAEGIIKGITISNNEGPAIFARSDKTYVNVNLSIEACEISNNEGGGIIGDLEEHEKVIINDAIIRDNGGHGVSIDGLVEMSDVVITGNSDGGAFGYPAYIGGSVVIKDNYANGDYWNRGLSLSNPSTTLNNLSVAMGDVIVKGELDADSEIGLSFFSEYRTGLLEKIVVTAEKGILSEANAEKFSLDINHPSFKLEKEAEGLAVADSPTEFYIAEDGNDNNEGTENSPFASVQRAADAISFLRDYSTDNNYTLYVSGKITDEGTSIFTGNEEERSMIHLRISEDATVILKAPEGENGIIDATGKNKRVLYMQGPYSDDDVHLILNDNVTIMGGNLLGGDGGGIYLHGDCTMEGGTITRNSVIGNDSTNPYGGGVRVEGDFLMKGGTISYNTATSIRESYGGGVSAANVIMEGGAITHNEIFGPWDSFGGGIYSGDFTMKEGLIANNSASYGGGVNTDNVIMEGGIIECNIAHKVGGGVSTFCGVITGGKIKTNTAFNGGGIYANSGYVDVLDNAYITENTSTLYGGGIVGCRNISGNVFISGNSSLRDLEASNVYDSSLVIIDSLSETAKVGVSPLFDFDTGDLIVEARETEDKDSASIDISSYLGNQITADGDFVETRSGGKTFYELEIDPDDNSKILVIETD